MSVGAASTGSATGAGFPPAVGSTVFPGFSVSGAPSSSSASGVADSVSATGDALNPQSTSRGERSGAPGTVSGVVAMLLACIVVYVC